MPYCRLFEKSKKMADWRIGEGPSVLKIRKHSYDFLHFFGTFILELYVEFLSAPVMFINLIQIHKCIQGWIPFKKQVHEFWCSIASLFH
jgi:hypothetical protein